MSDIPLGGTLKRCKHGVYDPHGDGYFCQWCNPALNDSHGVARKVRWARHKLHGDDLRANKNPMFSSKCPECGEEAYFKLPQKEKECCNCGAVRDEYGKAVHHELSKIAAD